MFEVRTTTILPIERHQLPMPGIYFLWLENNLQYVGQSSNLLKRIGEHIASKAFDSYSFIECDVSELERIEIEKAYIKQYSPPLNCTHSAPRSIDQPAMVDASEYANLINEMRTSTRITGYKWDRS